MKILDSKISASNFGRAWDEEQDEQLVRVEKCIRAAQRRLAGSNREESTWLWCAAACDLGRFRRRKPGRCLHDHYDILKQRFSILQGATEKRSGRKSRAQTGVTNPHVENPGEVVLYDPDYPSTMYKVSLGGGKLDWFKKDEVCIDRSVATAARPRTRPSTADKAAVEQRAAEEKAAEEKAIEEAARKAAADEAAALKKAADMEAAGQCSDMFSPEEFAIAVPTYRREDKISEKTLALLRRHAIPPRQVYIFVADEDEKRRYSAVLKDEWPNIIVGRHTLWKQRNFITSYFAEGRHVVSLDDDVEDLYRIRGDRLSRECLEPLHAGGLVDMIKVAWEKMMDLNAYIWSCNVSNNALSMCKDNRVSTRCGLCNGFFWGCRIRHEPTLLLRYGDGREDVERSLRFFNHDGRVLRFRGIAANAEVKTNCGGLQARWSCSERSSEEVRSIQALATEFPHLLKPQLDTPLGARLYRGQHRSGFKTIVNKDPNRHGIAPNIDASDDHMAEQMEKSSLTVSDQVVLKVEENSEDGRNFEAQQRHFICCNPDCNYAVHSNAGICKNFCCRVCEAVFWNPGRRTKAKHGKRCQHILFHNTGVQRDASASKQLSCDVLNERAPKRPKVDDCNINDMVLLKHEGRRQYAVKPTSLLWEVQPESDASVIAHRKETPMIECNVSDDEYTSDDSSDAFLP